MKKIFLSLRLPFAIFTLALLIFHSDFMMAVLGTRRGDQWSKDELILLSSLQLRKLPPVPQDFSNKYQFSESAIALGKVLFYDTDLSANKKISCASCHVPEIQYQDNRSLALGMGTGSRRTMPIADLGYESWHFWDGRKDSLWSQSLGPIENRNEHDFTRLACVHLIEKKYRDLYQNIFGPLPNLINLPLAGGPFGTKQETSHWDSLNIEQKNLISSAFANIGKAIGAYVSTLHHQESRVDKYILAVLEHNDDGKKILSSSEKNGLRIFITKGQCSTCHNGPLYSDHHFHNTGVRQLDGNNPDLGRAAGVDAVIEDEYNCVGIFSDAKPNTCGELRYINKDKKWLLGSFKTPSLRGVELRQPFMHAGQIVTLKEVITHYTKRPQALIGHDERNPISLSKKEIADLEAFLKSLNSDIIEKHFVQ